MSGSARPLVGVYSVTGDAGSQVKLPDVFRAPVRHDIVNFVHTQVCKNARIPYAVCRRAGHRTSAESWGTGRAVSRIPRVAGGGTSRSGQGAFGNMCRGGHMFSPTKVFRRWNRKCNKNMRRYAVCCALAASAVPALVMARGHQIRDVPEIPLVVSNKIQGINKTKQAKLALTALNAVTDSEKVKATKKVRVGKGKRRNRRYVQKKGPMIVFQKNQGGFQGFRNLPGVTLAKVSALNILDLAPGGHLGRFIIWSEDAFTALRDYFGVFGKEAGQRKYKMPTPLLKNSDITSIINSKAIQAITRPQKPKKSRKGVEHNPLRHNATMFKLRPYEFQRRRMVATAIATRRALEKKGQLFKQKPKIINNKLSRKAFRAEAKKAVKAAKGAKTAKAPAKKK